jgi:hypothetical protein
MTALAMDACVVPVVCCNSMANDSVQLLEYVLRSDFVSESITWNDELFDTKSLLDAFVS